MTRTLSSEHITPVLEDYIGYQSDNELPTKYYFLLTSTEWHGAKVFSRSSSALHPDEAIAIFFKKFAYNIEVEP